MRSRCMRTLPGHSGSEIAQLFANRNPSPTVQDELLNSIVIKSPGGTRKPSGTAEHENSAEHSGK